MHSDFYNTNRSRFMEVISGGVAVFSAYSQMQRSSDTAFLFDQEANFWYLTGIDAPDWWVIIDGTRQKSWLVASPVSPVHEVFEGSLSAEKAKKISGADGVITRGEAQDMLRDLSRSHSVVYTLDELPGTEYVDFHLNPAIRQMRQLLQRTFSRVQNARPWLVQLRAIKQTEEIEVIKKAVKLTVDAFEEVKTLLPALRYEYEVEAEFTYRFRKNGAKGHAYDPIVAGAQNACTLHYSTNNDKLHKGQLVLLDIGARYHGYAADVTRTYAYGTPTLFQKDVHDAVEEAHGRIISLIRPGMLVAEYYGAVDSIMKEMLVTLGLIDSPDDENGYRTYFPHAISHGLGVDVHDSLGRPKVFEPGMLLTVEPGIYVAEKGVGVRIEDDILVTSKGNVNLSGHLSTGL